jgi:hypothetical protein
MEYNKKCARIICEKMRVVREGVRTKMFIIDKKRIKKEKMRRIDIFILRTLLGYS